MIELLVVISIIGFLTSVSLATLNSVRDDAANAAIKQNMNSIRASAAVYYDEHQTYDGLIQHHPVNRAINAALAAFGQSASSPSIQLAHGEVYVFTVRIRTRDGSDRYWCVDSTGVAKETGNIGSLSHCP